MVVFFVGLFFVVFFAVDVFVVVIFVLCVFVFVVVIESLDHSLQLKVSIPLLFNIYCSKFPHLPNKF